MADSDFLMRFPLQTLSELQSHADLMDSIKKKEELKNALLKVKPFSKNESTKEAVANRIERARDFWYFDRVYFPKTMYDADDYAPPGKFHKEIVALSDLHDQKAHLILGPRNHAKTAMLKKKAVHTFLYGTRKFMAIGSETLETPKSYLLDIIYMIDYNDRILNDFNLHWHEKSTEKLFATSDINPGGTFVTTLSEEKSSRGKQRLMNRLDFILLTDFENLTSSLTAEALEKRVDRINEMRGSLTKDGTLVWEANNTHVDYLSNQLLEEQDNGLISENFVVHLYAAWDESRHARQKALWYSRFPANTEDELKQMLKPKDDLDWSGNFQQRPRRKSGDIFPDTYYSEWEVLPDDVQSVIWTDPNTSEKGKGDTTAMPCLGFSSSMQKYYVTDARCRSYFHSNELLTDIIELQDRQSRMGVLVITLGMDGNVNQESNWKNNIFNFTQIHKVPYPTVLFRKYKVDALAVNLESVWKENRILFPPGFAKTEEGKKFLKQFFGFRLKVAGKKDDAPDAMICAYTLLIELGIGFILDDTPLIITYSNRKVRRV